MWSGFGSLALPWSKCHDQISPLGLFTLLLHALVKLIEFDPDQGQQNEIKPPSTTELGGGTLIGAQYLFEQYINYSLKLLYSPAEQSHDTDNMAFTSHPVPVHFH